MKNPLSTDYSETTNQELVRKSLAGDRKSINELIQLHQPFIYNVAWKMTFDAHDAMDLTQETLLKVVINLSKFNFKSNFRTWLYRIVVNEFLQTKRRKGEKSFSDFKAQGKRLDAIPNTDINLKEELELEELIKELRYRCLSGMLMCLNREQRLVYIIGETFGVDHTIGAEIFNITKQNFRVKLHRARKDLYNFMKQKCGLVNPENPCRCAKKAKTMHQKGYLTEDKKFFNIGYKKKIADYVSQNYEASADAVDEKHAHLFRDLPARDKFDAKTIVDEILNDNQLMKYFNFN